MTLLISYQGIFSGTNFENADLPAQIQQSLNAGFSVMVDLWSVGGQLYLGAGQPITPITAQSIQGNRYWLNCQNLEAQNWIVTQPANLYPNYFWYSQSEILPPYVTTSGGQLWTFGNTPINNSSIIFLPEQQDKGLLSTVNLTCYGICTNYCTIIRRMRTEGRCC